LNVHLLQKRPRLEDAGSEQQQRPGALQPLGLQPGGAEVADAAQPRIQYLAPRRADGVSVGQFRRQQRDSPKAAPRNQPAVDGGPSPNDVLETQLIGLRQSEEDMARQCHVSIILCHVSILLSTATYM